jgi:hypothetical protein
VPIKALASPAGPNLLPGLSNSSFPGAGGAVNPLGVLVTPATPGSQTLVLNNDPTNIQFKISGFLNGVVSAAIESAVSAQLSGVPTPQPSPMTSEVVVEGEVYPGDFIPLALFDPEQAPTPGSGNSQGGFVWALRGPGKAGWARVPAMISIRARRTDLNGGLINVAINFREGAV